MTLICKKKKVNSGEFLSFMLRRYEKVEDLLFLPKTRHVHVSYVAIPEFEKLDTIAAINLRFDKDSNVLHS